MGASPVAGSSEPGPSSGSGRREWNEVAALQRRRIDHHLLAGGPELLEVAVSEPTELDDQHAPLAPVARLVELDTPDDGLDRMSVQPLRHLTLVDRSRTFGGCRNQLAGGIEEGRNVMAELVGAALLGNWLVAGEEVPDARELQCRLRHVEVEINE